MTSKEPTYWFPAKLYGWGWGLPTRWQGWVVVAAYLCLLGLCAWLTPPHWSQSTFLALVGVLTALIAICWVKGEPPNWHWGT